MKGLILSGGKGTRLRPLTYTRAKQLLPLANKPVLFYAIEALLSAGIHEIGIIVGDTHEEIRAAVLAERERGSWGDDLRLVFVQQEAPLGLAHAVLTARDFLGEDRFLMFLGDNLIGEPLGPLVDRFDDPDSTTHAQILLTQVPNPREFGVAELDGMVEGAVPRIKRLIEKPADPPSNLALVGVYCFDRHIFEAASSIRPSARGELEITDAIQWLIDHGYTVRPHLLTSYWIDTGKMEDILSANRQVLAGLKRSIAPDAEISPDSTLQGEVVVQAGAVITSSLIRGPAIIGERARIAHAYIGPFSSIYHDAQVVESEVEYTIALEHAEIKRVQGRIEASLIGRYAQVHSSPARPKAHRVMLGDYSQVSLPDQ